MTKKEIINKIKEMEAKAYSDLNDNSAIFGMEHQYTKFSRGEWSALYGVLKAIGEEIQ